MMNIKLLDNNMEIREAFMNRFVMSWDEFQVYYQDKELVDFVAEADVQILAARIEKEWFDSYRLTHQ